MRVTKFLQYLISGLFVYLFLSVTNLPIAKAYTDANSDLATGVAPRGMAWGNSGLRLVTVGETNSISQFTCSTAYDVSSCSKDGSIDASLSNETGVDFNGDGSSLFISTSSSDQVREVSLTTNWTPLDGISVGAAITTDDNNQDTDLQFSTDGTMLFVVDHKSDRVKKYELDSAFTITAGSTISSTQQSAQSEDTNTRGLGFSPDGLIMYMIGLSQDRPRMYTMTAPYDLSTSVAVGSATTPGGAQFTNILFNADGSKMYMGDVGGTIYEYDLDDAYEIINIPTIDSSTPADNATGIAVDANIVLNWDQAVDAESGNILIKKTSDNSTVATIDVTGDQVTGSGSTTITINPTDDLDASTEYYITIATTAFDNASSVSYPGMTGTRMLSFTTAAASSSSSTTDPTTDSDVVASINVNSVQVKGAFVQSVGVVSNRLGFLRNNRSRENFSKQNFNFDFGNSLLNSLTKIVPVSNKLPENIIPDDWSIWTEGTLSFTKVAEQLDASVQESSAQGIAIGLDKKIDENNLYGFAFQFTQNNTDVGSSGSEVDSNFYNFSVYGTKPHNNNNFIEGSFGLGLIQSDMIRVSGSNKLTGSRDGKQLFGSLNYGKNISDGEYSFIPKARVDLSYTELDGYTEKGTDALSYSDQTLENGIASFGLTINKQSDFEDKSIFHYGTFELGTDFSNSSTATMHYVSDASTTYSSTQGINSNYLGTAEFGLMYDANDNLSATASYKRIQGYDNYKRTEHTDTFKFGFNFEPRRETEYAMTFDASEELLAGFDISKNIIGLDFNFNAQQEFNNNKHNSAEVSLSKKF